MQTYFFKGFILIVLLLGVRSMEAAISFRDISIDQAVQIAKLENKFVFVDTYASWCGPCKVMDKVFDEEEVSRYFNANFVSVKIDMEGRYGEEVLHDYQVVWLPTLLVLNTEGEVVSKIDKLMTGYELIEAATNAKSGYSSVPTSSLNNNPFSQNGNHHTVKDYDPIEKERVIYVHDDRVSSGRPHIMYHEAYLHLQLHDGKHTALVKKYLSTQEDWSTEKNIKFIFDFLQDVRSAQFDYFVSHRQRFEEVIPKERIDRSLDVLINQRLYKGYPRPSLEEAKKLLIIADPVLGEQKAYQYFLRRLVTEQRDLEYLQIGDLYLSDYNPFDDEVLHQYVAYRLSRREQSASFDQEIDYMTRAISLNDDNADYRLTMSHIYFQRGDKIKALQFINEAIALSRPDKPNYKSFVQFKERVVEEL